MSLVDVDSWSNEFDSCERLGHSIQNLCAQRNPEIISSSEYAKITGQIRIRLKQFETELSQLNLKLNVSTKNQSLTMEERERRLQQIDRLQSQYSQLQNKFTSNSDYSNYFAGQSTASVLWEDDERDAPIINRTTNLNAKDLRDEQIRILEDQNKGLEALSATISRQKKLASTFGQEVESQNDILDNIADSMERIEGRVNTEIRSIDEVHHQDSTWGYWTIIIILFIAIVVLSLV